MLAGFLVNSDIPEMKEPARTEERKPTTTLKRNALAHMPRSTSASVLAPCQTVTNRRMRGQIQASTVSSTVGSTPSTSVCVAGEDSTPRREGMTLTRLAVTVQVCTKPEMGMKTTHSATVAAQAMMRSAKTGGGGEH